VNVTCGYAADCGQQTADENHSGSHQDQCVSDSFSLLMSVQTTYSSETDAYKSFSNQV